MAMNVNPNNGALYAAVASTDEYPSDFIGDAYSVYDTIELCTTELCTTEDVRDTLISDNPVHLIRVLNKRLRYYDVDDTDDETIAAHPSEYSCMTVVSEVGGHSYYIHLSDHASVWYYRANNGDRDFGVTLTLNSVGHDKPTRISVTAKEAIAILKNARFGREHTKGYLNTYDSISDLVTENLSSNTLAFVPVGSVFSEVIDTLDEWDHMPINKVTEAVCSLAVKLMIENRFAIYTYEHTDMVIEAKTPIYNINERYNRLLSYIAWDITHRVDQPQWETEMIYEMYDEAKHVAKIGSEYTSDFVFVNATPSLRSWVASTRAPVELTPCGTMFVLTPEVETLAITSLEEPLVYR